MARPKGSPNRNTQLFRERLEGSGFDIVSEGIRLYNELTREDMKVKCYDILVGYAYAKPKPQETGGDGNLLDMLNIMKQIPTEVLLKALKKQEPEHEE